MVHIDAQKHTEFQSKNYVAEIPKGISECHMEKKMEVVLLNLTSSATNTLLCLCEDEQPTVLSLMEEEDDAQDGQQLPRRVVSGREYVG